MDGGGHVISHHIRQISGRRNKKSPYLRFGYILSLYMRALFSTQQEKSVFKLIFQFTFLCNKGREMI